MKTPDRRSPKAAVYEQFARIGKAFASPTRLELLDLLCQGPRTVEVLAREAGLSVANASQHLQALRGARLVDADKHGLFVTYRLADEMVCDFFRALRLLAEKRLAEVELAARELLEHCGDAEPVSPNELLARARRGEVTVLDVRPPEEYRAAHLPGAVSIPLAELKRRIAELPRGRLVVAYCRGPYCLLAVRAVELLRQRGYRATRLPDGVPEWRARGLAVATGDTPQPAARRSARHKEARP